MKKVITIVGARPQFVKASTLSRQFILKGIEELIVHTGQHFDANMSDVFFEELEIPRPKYELNIHGLSHGAMTARMLEAIEKILMDEKPDGVLVYGDTNSTLAGALAASKLGIPLIHIEAGLRSFNMLMPEEINRIITDRVSNLLFCPTDVAVSNLKSEGIDTNKIIKNGDVMQDAFLYFSEKAKLNSTILDKIVGKTYILATVHRQGNTDNPENLANIIRGLNQLNQLVPVIIPVHPRTKSILKNNNIQVDFQMIDPVSYLDMIVLLQNCAMVVTDSGGLQKEAFFAHKHCITLREETEWTELVDNGYNILVGTDTDKLMQAFETLSAKKSDFSLNLYGNGIAAEKAVEEILKM